LTKEVYCSFGLKVKKIGKYNMNCINGRRNIYAQILYIKYTQLNN